MSKALVHMNPEDRRQAIIRRIREDNGGLGTIAAKEAIRKGAVSKKEIEPAQED